MVPVELLEPVDPAEQGRQAEVDQIDIGDRQDDVPLQDEPLVEHVVDDVEERGVGALDDLRRDGWRLPAQASPREKW
jgi:hypothetical protein